LVEISIAPNPDNRRGGVSMWRAGATNPMWEEIRRRQDGKPSTVRADIDVRDRDSSFG